MGSVLATVPMAVLAIGTATACATKAFVQTRVSAVNEKAESLGKSVELTQERAQKNEGRIDGVAQQAQTAQQSAQRAGQSALQADKTASMASTLAKQADAKADALDKASRRPGRSLTRSSPG